MITDKTNLPFNYLFEEETLNEVNKLVYTKCKISFSKEIALNVSPKIIEKLKRYINIHFDLVSYFNTPKNNNNEVLKSINEHVLATYYKNHPLLNENNYNTFNKIIDSLIENDRKYLKDLISLYEDLHALGVNNSLLDIKNELVNKAKEYNIDEIIEVLNDELLNLSITKDSRKDVINLYKSLIEYYKTQRILTPKRTKVNQEYFYFEDLLTKNFRNKSQEILNLLYISSPPIVDEFNHWIGELQAAYVFWECLRAEGFTTATLESLKNVFQGTFKNFNSSGVKKPTTTSRAYDYKKDFIDRLHILKIN